MHNSGVIGDNNPPKANGQSLMTQEDTALPIVLTGSDADGETLTFSIVNGPANGALTGLTQMPPTSAGVTYTPNGDYNGPDSFVFRADDGNAGSATAVVNITVKPVDDPPIANDDVFSTAQNQTATRNVLFNDSDPDGDPLTVVSVTQGANGSVTTDGTNATYVPDEDFVGMDSFTYTISDGTSTDTATVIVTVRPPGGPSANEAPVAASLAVMTNQDTDLVITLTGSDPDSDPLAFSITSPPANGTLGPITKTGSAVAMVTYTPDPNYDGPDSFGFRVDDGEETATAAVQITVKPTTNLSFAKTLLSAEFKAGTQVTYRITVTNDGPKDATGVLVSDNLPAGLSFVSGSGASACSAAGQLVACNAISLPKDPPNNMAMWDMTVMIAASATGDVTNTANVTSPSDPNSPKMAQDGPRMINVMADLLLDKAVTSADFKAGQQATYTITITNNGPADATSVTVNDTIPAPLSLVSATPSQGSPCAGDPAITCNLGTITSGSSATVIIVVDIPASATGTVTNTATVSSPDDAMAGNNSDTDMTPINVMADLRIEKTDNPDPVVAGGGNLTYTLTVTNDGPADATSVTVTDILPAGVTFVSTSGCTEDPNGVPACTLGALAAGSSAMYTITVSVDPDASGSLTNTATVVANETDPNSGNNMVMEDTDVQGNVDLSITKTDGLTTVVAGTQLTYTITAANAGPSDAIGAMIADTIPIELVSLNLVSCMPIGVGAACDPSLTPGPLGGNNFNATVDLPVGGSVAYQISGTVQPSATGTLTNTATVAAPAGTTETNPGDNSATDSDTAITQQADLTITKGDSPDPVVAGNQLVYTVTVTNNGPSDAAGVVVSDALPAGVSSSTTAGDCAEGAGGVPTCTLGAIVSGASKQYTITVDVDMSTTGTITNNASVASTTTLINTGDDSVMQVTTVNQEADLSITKSDNTDPVIAGSGTITYTVTVNNAGPSDATNVIVTDTLPGGVTFVSTSGCGEDPNGGATCSLGTIAANASKQYTITVSVDASASGTLTNTASVSSDVTDPNSGNNMVMEDTAVQSNVDLSISKTDGLAMVVAGTELTYTITAANAGPSDAVGAMISDTIPIELVSLNLVSCMPVGVGTACDPGLTPGPLGSNNFNATVDLPVGGSLAYQISGTVDPSATGTLANTATVTPPGGVTDTFPGNDSATDNDTAITKEADLSIAKTGPATATAGGMLTYTVTVTNNGPSDASNVVVTDNLPVPSAGGSLTFKPAPDSSVECSEGAGVITCSLAGLPAAAGSNTKVYTLAFDVSANAMGTIDNPASVAADEPDPVAGNNAAAAPQVTIAKEAELTITKSDNNDPVIAGSGAITYTVTVNNAGPSDATDVVVTDPLPAGVTLVSTAGDCSAVPGVPTCTLGTITANSSKQFTINVTVDSAATGTITNNATVASSTPLGAGSVTNVDQMTTVNTEAAITVTKDDGAPTLNPGDPTTYTIVISNAGPSDLTGATVSDVFPAGIASTSTMSVAAGGATGNTVGPFAGNISDTVNIPDGGSITYTVVAQTGPAATGTLANMVTVTGGVMSLMGTTSATDTDTLTPSGNLSITKGDDIDPILTGNVLTYTIVVSNSGPSTATGVTVTDTFPAQFTNPMWTCLAAGAGSSCAPMGAGNLVAEPVNIGPGGSVTFTVTGTISTAVATQITNTASLSVPMGFTDSDGAGNNTVMETTDLTVNDPPMASIAGSSTAGVVGELLTLMGSNSTDDGLPAPPATLTFDWTFTSVPAGSTIPTGSTFSTVADTMFTPDLVGTYMATLTVDDSAANDTAMLTVNVSAADTTTAITGDPTDPSTLSSPYAVSGTVTAVAPSGAVVNEGTVDVTGGSTCMSAVTSGTFSCMVTSMTAGAKTLVATYNGTANFNGSPSAGEAHTVNMGTTTTSVDSSSPTPSIFPNAFQVNFTVTGTPVAPGPTGMVTVTLSGGGSCMGTVAAGTCMLTPAMTGMQTLTATYPGDSNYQGSADAVGIPHTVSPPPMAVADMFDIVGNTPFEHAGTQTISEGLFFAGNVLSNDTGIGIMVTSASPIATALGASVTINAAGEFIYDGNAACGPNDTNMSDSFMYAITGGTMATVTLDCDAQVWWVKNDDTGGDTGTHANPFQTLAQADGVVNSNSGNFDTIFVYEGDGTDTGQDSGITLLNVQRLIGEGIALTIDNTLNMVAGPHTLTAAGNQPKISGASPGVTVFNVSAVISGLDITAGTAGGSGDNGVQVDCNAPPATRLVEISNNTIAGVQRGIVVSNAGCTYELDISNNNITATGASIDNAGILVVGNGNPITPTFITNFDSNTVGDESAAGILGTGIFIRRATFDAVPTTATFQAVTGGTTIIGESTSDRVGENGLVLGIAGHEVSGILVFTGLEIFANGTGLAVVGSGALTASTGFGLTVPDGSIINAIGVAVDLDPLTAMFGTSGGSQVTITGQSAAFDQVAGMLFFSSSSALASTTAATAFSVSGGIGDLSYAGTIANTAGNSVVVTGRTSDTVSFTGAIDDDAAGISLTSNTGGTISFSGGLDLDTTTNTAFTATGGGTVNSTSGTNTIDTTSGQALNINNTLVDLDFAHVIQTAGSTTGVNIATNTGGTVDITKMQITKTSGAGAAVGLANTTSTFNFNVDVAGATNGSLISSNVDALVAAGTNLGVNLAMTNSSGGTNNVKLMTNTGTANLGGGALSASSGSAFSVDGGNAVISYSGSTTNGTGLALDIKNTTGGTVTVGTVADTTAAGITIASNAAVVSVGNTTITNSTNSAVDVTSNTANVSFADLDITNTTSNQRGLFISANASGTTSSTSGTINTGSGIAVDIDNSALGITLTSVSANGASSGIDINTTTGSFTVTGDGTTGAGTTANNDSGGVIQNATGDGIILTSTSGVSLNQMRIQDAADNGVNATSVSGLSLTRADLISNGTANQEHGLKLTNATGTVTVNNTLGDSNFDAHLRVFNDTSNITLFTVNDGDFKNVTTGAFEEGISFELRTGRTGAISVTNSKFNNHDGDHVQASCNGSAVMTATITGNDMDGAAGNLGAGITVNCADTFSGTTNFTISGNNIQKANDNSATINVNIGSSSNAGTFTGTIANNIIGTLGNADSAGDTGISTEVNQNATMTVAVSGNTIREFDNIGIDLGAVDGTGTLNATVTGNTVTSADSNNFGAVFVDAQTNNTACADIGGAGALQNTLSASAAGFLDVGLKAGGTGGTINLEGYGGAANDNTAIQTYLQGRNVGSPVVFLDLSGSGTVQGGGGCPTPP